MIQQAPIELALGMNLDGTFTRCDVFEALPTQESHVISVNASWGVNLEWEISSAIPGNPHNVLLMPSVFRVDVLLEGFGPGANEYILPAGGFQVNYGPPVLPIPGGNFVDPTTRRWTIPITFNPANQPILPGLYKLGVVLQLSAGAVPLPAAGFVEGPLIQFF